MHIHCIKSHEIESYTDKKRRIEEVKQEYYSHRKVRSTISGRPISRLFARGNKITTGENDQQTPAIYVSKEFNSF